MLDADATIRSERLDLIPMTPEFLEASLRSDVATAEVVLGSAVPPDWFAARDLIRLRLDGLREEPELLPWLLRAIVLRAERRMVGHIGFHTAPGADYLSDLAPDGVEFGYTVFAADRRRGYAREAALALMDWARTTHGVPCFVVSISPSNQASLGLARQLGFRQIGTHIDEEDGPEDVFELRQP